MGYVGCVTAWRHDPRQTEACIRSRLPLAGRDRTVILNTYGQEAGRGAIAVSCIGAGGAGDLTLAAGDDPGRVPALQACLTQALRTPAMAVPSPYRLRYTPDFAIADGEQARAAAQTILLVAIDHVGIPRGVTGSCLVQGRLAQVIRGRGPAPGGSFEASIPCGARPDRAGPRRIRMGDLQRGTFAHAYVSADRTLLDFRRAE